MEFKWIIMVLLQACLCMVTSRKLAVNSNPLSREANLHKSHVIRSIESQDGDIIDCVDIYKQPAFDHPALRDHKLQLRPSLYAKGGTLDEGKKSKVQTARPQTWQKSGSCPKGTIPVRRMKGNGVVYRKPAFLNYGESKTVNLVEMNHSIAILHTEGYAYYGGKADMKVWNPEVEKDDEFSTSQVALKIKPQYGYEAVEAGWMANPRVYGERKTRLFANWTVDGNVKTGCFDITCPGFVQTSNEIALGAAIYPISTLNGLPYMINIFVHKDPNTSNWWVTYGGTVNIGCWPAKLFVGLKHHATTVQWSGEVYSTRVGMCPHTTTAMGNGRFPDWVKANSGAMFGMRVLESNQVTRYPRWVFQYTDEYDCYKTRLVSDYVEDPEFFYGGPEGSPFC